MIAFIPKTVHCAKCNKPLIYGKDFHRRQKGPRRYLIATCHGEEAELEFVVSDKEMVTLWGEGQPAK